MSEEMPERMSEDVLRSVCEVESKPDAIQEINSPDLTGDEADIKFIVVVVKCHGGDHSK